MTKKKQSKIQKRAFTSKLVYWLGKLRKTRNDYLSRRPHRTFRLTMRRDYTRSLQLPGYWEFTRDVHRVFLNNKRIFGMMSLTYAVITIVLVGVASQNTYTVLTDALSETGSDIFEGNFAALGQAGLLFLTAASGGITNQLTEAQQVYAGLIGLFTWLTTVWILRSVLAGRTVRLRDGLYNSGAPILSTAIVMVVLVVQLLPLLLALIGYGAAVTTGFLNGGVEAMMFWFFAAGLALLSLYWVTSTIIALVVVTLPGMYPFKALATAGDLVIGRRLRILLRLLWAVLVVLVTWAIVLIPIIMLDTWLKSFINTIDWVPTIPVALLGLGSLTIVWCAGYVYMLYRKVVADDADPA